MKTRYFCKCCWDVIESDCCPNCGSSLDVVEQKLYTVTVPSFEIPVWGEDAEDAEEYAFDTIGDYLPDFETEERD